MFNYYCHCILVYHIIVHIITLYVLEKEIKLFSINKCHVLLFHKVIKLFIFYIDKSRIWAELDYPGLEDLYVQSGAVDELITIIPSFVSSKENYWIKVALSDALFATIKLGERISVWYSKILWFREFIYSFFFSPTSSVYIFKKGVSFSWKWKRLNLSRSVEKKKHFAFVRVVFSRPRYRKMKTKSRPAPCTRRCINTACIRAAI